MEMLRETGTSHGEASNDIASYPPPLPRVTDSMHRLTRLSLAYPKLTVAILAAITVALGAGLPKVRTEFGYRVLLGDTHDSIQRLDALIDQFGG